MPNILRSMPVPVAGNKAVGPVKLSTQPGNGSRHDAPTMDGRTMAHGILFLHSCNPTDQ